MRQQKSVRWQSLVKRKGRKGRTNDPNYETLSGLVWKPLARRFKSICTEEELDIGDALTPYLLQFVQEREGINPELVPPDEEQEDIPSIDNR